MKTKLKISASAYRVLLLLKKLNEKDYSIDELNEIFWKDPCIKRYFSRDVILKYINTLKLAGFKISRPAESGNSCYRLNNSRMVIDFSEEELKTLAILKRYAKSLHQKKFTENYRTFLFRLQRFMSEKSNHKLQGYCDFYDKEEQECYTRFDKHSELIKKIETFIEERQRVEVKYKLPEEEEKRASTELQGIKYEHNDVSLVCYNLVSNQTNTIKIKHILDIRQLPVVSKNSQILCPVLFKVKDKLAKVYRPYEKEKIAEPDEHGHITVTSYPDDLEGHLKRLLRYGVCCEVIYPKMAREKMKELINGALANYG